MSTTPRISLCLIVKDEEDFLGPCLDSARALAHEIVVVDTGSTDGTVAIARSRGARVIDFPWTGSFSEARNVSLDAATGDFVLVLDADERLAPASVAVVQAIVAREAPDAPPTVYLPLIDNRDQEGNALGADHMPRLWRSRPELRFTGRVHEQIGVGVPGLRRVYDDAIRIVHLGYDPTVASERGKGARNRALLEAELAARPDDPAVWFYLAKEHYAAGEDAAALAGFRRVIDDGRLLNLVLSSAIFATECLVTLGRPTEALSIAQPVLKRAEDYGELWFAAAKAAFEAGQPDQALAWLPNASRVPAGWAATAFRDPSVAEWRAEALRARALRAVGALDEAARAFARCRGAAPADERDRLDLDAAEVAVAQGRVEDAWRLLEPLIARAPLDVGEVLLPLIQHLVVHAGLPTAYSMLTGILQAHAVLLHVLALVGAAVDLSEAVGDDAGRVQWLTLCTLLDSPHPEHYLALADARAAAGALDDAARLRARAARLLEGADR